MDDTQEVAVLSIASEPAERARSQRSAGEGPTEVGDDDSIADSPFFAAMAHQAHERKGLSIQSRLMSAQANEAAERRNEAWEAFLKSSRWHQHQWLHTRFFAGVLLAATLLIIVAFVTNDLRAKLLAGALLLPCVGRALLVLRLTPSRIVTLVSNEADTSVKLGSQVPVEPDEAA